jgi:type VI secretion system secreted protein VgrG
VATLTTYTQAGRPMTVKTPLGPDNLLLIGFSGREAISQLFEYSLELIAPNQAEIPFDKLLAQKVSVALELSDGQKRYFSGIVRRFSQGHRDDTFTYYRMEVVPQFWLLKKKIQSRIFQHKTVPDILKDVFKGLDVGYEIQGTFSPREYCVQYRESDFDFASRLMEEEGIYYFFTHTADGHKTIVANLPQSHPDVAPATLIYEEMTGGVRKEDRVAVWEKGQELRSGKFTLWDHCFELPHKHLEAEKIIPETVKSGKADHKLKVGNNDRLEIYDYPGGYAKRFDGVNKSGGDQSSELQKVFQDNLRTVGIRMQEEAAPSVVIHGLSNCRQLSAGHRFTLQRHFNADGKYLLTALDHTASLSAHYRAGDAGEFSYENSFTCIPSDMVFRPPRMTPKPRVDGSQTAVVVGPPGEEIFTDKYSRVKVQFHWDRSGQNDADSSCWVRVATLWAGKQWGVIHIPRIGHEVVVDFLEGDPDRPIIVGSVYNADMMPPYALPDNRTQSGVKSRSSLQGGPANFNELRFEDKKGSEQIFLHAEKDSLFETEHDNTEWVGHDEKITIDHDQTTVVHHDRTETVDHDEKITIGNNRTTDVGKDETLTVGQHIKIDAGQQITIQTGASKIVMKSDGTIQIQGISITVEGTKSIENKGVLITSEASGIHTIKGSLVKIN